MLPSSNARITFLGLSIWMLLVIFFLYEFFLRTFLGTIAHQIMTDLQLTPEAFSIMGSAYYLIYGLMQIPVGIIADRFGIRLVATIAIVICAIATVVFAKTNNFTIAFICRILTGFGSSFAFICMLMIIIEWFPRNYFALITGCSQFIGTLGPMLAGGPLMNFIINSHNNWRHIFTVIGYFGLVLAASVALFVKKRPTTCPQKAIVLNPKQNLSTQMKQLFLNRQAWAIALFTATLYAPIVIFGAVWGTEYLHLKGLSQTHAAQVISCLWLGFAIGCPLHGFISDYSQRRKPLLVLSSVAGAVLISIIVCSAHLSFQQDIVLFFMLGIIIANHNNGFATIAENVTQSSRATAIGLNNGLISLFSASIPIIVALIISHVMHNSQQSTMTYAHITSGLMILPGLHLLAAGIALFGIKETYCKPTKDIIYLVTSSVNRSEAESS